MKKSLALVLMTLLLSAFVGACGGGGAAPAPPAGPQPTPAAQDPGGIRAGLSVTAASPDVFTSFEFNAVGPFSVGVSPFAPSRQSTVPARSYWAADPSDWAADWCG